MTLTQTAVITKRAIIILIIGLILAVAGRIGWEFYYRYQISKIPPPVEQAEAGFGPLQLILPPSKVSSTNFTYAIDTTTGELPNFPRLIKVYFIPRAGLSLLAPERARVLANKLGFANGPETSSPDLYRFTDDLEGELVIDIPSGNFHFSKPSEASASGASLPTKERMVATLKSFLADKIEVGPDLNDGRGDVLIDPNNPTSAVISLWPKDIDGLSIISIFYHRGLVRATAVAGDESIKFHNLNYIYWPVDLTSFSTYQLKTADEALSDLRAGKGYVIDYPSNSQISLTSLKLAYLQTEEYNPYLQPIYVFEGPSFIALIPALVE